MKLKREELALVSRTLDWVLSATQADEYHREQMKIVKDKFDIILKTCPDAEIPVEFMKENDAPHPR